MSIPSDELDEPAQKTSHETQQSAEHLAPRRTGGITSITYIHLSQLHAHLLQSPVTKALLGANTIYSNGSVLSRAGQAQVALAVRTECPGANVYVLAESVKCTERAALGTSSLAAVELAPENELIPAHAAPVAAPDDGAKSIGDSSLQRGKDSTENLDVGQVLTGWEEKENLFLMNALHDITPPDLIHALVTEVGTVPPGTAAAVGRMVGVGGELGEV